MSPIPTDIDRAAAVFQSTGHHQHCNICGFLLNHETELQHEYIDLYTQHKTWPTVPEHSTEHAQNTTYINPKYTTIPPSLTRN